MKAPYVYEELLKSIVTNKLLLARENEKWNVESSKLGNRLAELGNETSGMEESWCEEEQEIHGPIGP